MEEIKAGDIMLNNWFHVNGYPMYVDSIFRDTVYLEFEGNEGDVWEENIKDLKPIPLTEDILLKAGFEKDEEGLFSSYPTIVAKTKTRWAFYNNGLSGGELVRIDYLHQLQNLVRILTGNDLKINIGV